MNRPFSTFPRAFTRMPLVVLGAGSWPKAVPPISILRQIAPPLKYSWDCKRSSPPTRYFLGGKFKVGVHFLLPWQCLWVNSGVNSYSCHRVTQKVGVKVVTRAADQQRVTRSLWCYKITSIILAGEEGVMGIEIDGSLLGWSVCVRLKLRGFSTAQQRR